MSCVVLLYCGTVNVVLTLNTHVVHVKLEKKFENPRKIGAMWKKMHYVRFKYLCLFNLILMNNGNDCHLEWSTFGYFDFHEMLLYIIFAI